MCLLGPCNERTRFRCLIILTTCSYSSSTKTYGSRLHQKKAARLCGTTPICVRVSPPYNIWINTQALHCPLSFAAGPPHSLACSQRGGKPQLVSFSIHVFTQKSVKAAKSCEHSQLGISGKQVSSHFILYESKHTPGLGLRTMPLEWDAIHVAAQCSSCTVRMI